MVASVRVRSFSATGMDEKGYCLVLLLWAAGRTPYSSANLRRYFFALAISSPQRSMVVCRLAVLKLLLGPIFPVELRTSTF